MRKQDFSFDLPEELIANEPKQTRSNSRLMLLDPQKQSYADKQFHQLVDYIQPNDCLIFNDTKVIPARLQGKRDSGGKIEVMMERIIPASDLSSEQKFSGEKDVCIAQLRASNTPKVNTIIHIAEDFQLQVVEKKQGFYKLKNLSDEPLFDLIEQYGEMPLPPYIKRDVDEEDKSRYQTVYANKQGAVAAPTAGLHFDEPLLQALEKKGVAFGFVTLHVGAGTYLPMRVDNIFEHNMHSEWFEVSADIVELVQKTRTNGGRVIAVGTTSVRCLESASQSGQIRESRGETDIFIYPGYEFKSVDGLITNFHLSESTLLMLVSAFAGKDFILKQYRRAIKEKYRFFSYGDSMFIQNRVIEKS